MSFPGSSPRWRKVEERLRSPSELPMLQLVRRPKPETTPVEEDTWEPLGDVAVRVIAEIERRHK